MKKIGPKQNILVLMLSQTSKLFVLIFSLFISTIISRESWGVYAISQSLVIWIGLLLEYGFNISGVFCMSRCNESSKITALDFISKSTSGRFICFFIIISTLLLTFYFFPTSYIVPFEIVLISLLHSFSYALIPVWYFQSTDRIYLVAFVDIIISASSLFSLYLIAYKDISLSISLMFQSISCLSLCILTFIIAIKEIGKPSLSLTLGLSALKEDFSYFLNNSSISLFTSGATILIGGLFGVSQAGYYASAERIIKILNSISAPFIKVNFPKYSSLYSLNRRLHKRKLDKLLIYILGVFILVNSALFLSANWIAYVMYKDNWQNIANILKILSFTLIFVNLSSIISFFWIIPSQKMKEFNMITISAGFLNLILLFFFWRFYPSKYPWSIVIVEFILCLWLIYLRYHPINKEII